MASRRSVQVALVTAALVVLGIAVPVSSQLAPIPQDQGAAGLGLALRRLPVAARVLYVTAHPDDENNGVLVRLSRGLGVHTALLTLTRGDGGQNEIGPELFQAIGILRTEELAAIHRYDAVEQYFSRAYEFGYSFSVEETLERWGHQATLGDVVKVVRTFRPDVILTLSLEAAGGGQHHQAAARLAVEAFRAAADPARFPEQIQSGLRPWQAAKIYQGGIGGDAARIEGPKPVALDTGVYDPLLGMTWLELGSIARSFHKCQGSNQLKASPGAGRGQYFLVDSQPKVTAAETDVLDGVDTSLNRLSAFLQGEESRLPAWAAELERLESQVRAARAAFDANAPEKTVPSLAAGLGTVRRMRATVSAAAVSAGAELLDRLDQKEREFEAALRLAYGLTFEARADDDLVVAGETFHVSASVWNPGPLAVRVEDLSLRVPAGWTAKRVEGEIAPELSPRQGLRLRFAVTAPRDARASQPYWRLRAGVDRYDLDVPGDDTLPWSPPDVIARLRFADAAVETPAVWRYEGRWVGGEKQKVVSVVPALSLRVKPAILVVPTAGRPVTRELRVTVINNAREPGPATLRLELPPGWSADPHEAPLTFRSEGDEVTTRVFVKAPAGVPAGTHEIRAVAVATPDGREFREGDQVIAYDHIQERRLYHPAVTRALAVDVRVAPGVQVGYVMGAGDEVADAIRQLDVPLTLLTADDLAYGDLARFTTIVTGIRAYQTRPDLRAYHPRVKKYVEDGGHLVVQYNKFEFNQAVLARVQPTDAPAGGRRRQPDSPFAPYPGAVSSNRVTDELAPVELLMPGGAVLTQPNRLGDGDWAGWVQERGLYFLEARDARYRELVAVTDPFPKNPGRKTGALVEAPVGKGTWTYVGLGLFRQLPAGTPGAYRLLANLLSRPRGK